MLLYGSSDSGHSFKVRSFLLLANLQHRYEWIDLGLPREQRPAAFVTASRFGEVPVLVDEGRSLCQSNAILQYLARKTGRFTGGSGEWQTVLEWLSWETNRIGFSLPNYRFALLWSPLPADVMHYLLQRLLADLGTLEQHLEQHATLLESGLTIADLSCGAYLHWLPQVGLPLSDYPNITRWLQHMTSQPGWLHPDQVLARHASE